MLKRLLAVLLVLSILLLVSWCVLVEYTRTNLSSGAYLDKLAGQNVYTEDEAVAAILKKALQDLPWGKSGPTASGRPGGVLPLFRPIQLCGAFRVWLWDELKLG